MLGCVTERRKEPPASKCFFTHSSLPTYVDQKQPPVKRQPFNTILSRPFSHTLDLIVPEQHYERFHQELKQHGASLFYSRVIMSLSDLVTGEFFDEYIKTGNILMLSEGRPGIDNLYSLRDGTLTLELDKPTYERCGLPGTPISDSGRKHVKTRYAIELNLRVASMTHGRKGFERLNWAFKNVLVNPMYWLFHDEAQKGFAKGPVEKFHPVQLEIQPEFVSMQNVREPIRSFLHGPQDEIDLVEAHEWLGLAFLQSPRIRCEDVIDPYLSRYQVPSFGDKEQENNRDTNLIKLRWRGFVPSEFVTQVYLALRRVNQLEWAALNVSTFQPDAFTVLTAISKECYIWNCK